MFFTFPENAHWNAERQAVEFGVEIGEHRVVRVPRRVFQRLLPERHRSSGALNCPRHEARRPMRRDLARACWSQPVLPQRTLVARCMVNGAPSG